MTARRSGKAMATLADIEEIVGAEGLQKLCTAYGGCRLYIPVPSSLAANSGHWLVDCIGMPAALRLADMVAPHGHIDIPKLDVQRRGLRNAGIAQAARSQKVKDVAVQFGVTERTVFRVLSKSRCG